jgi:hypothetical protein
MPHKRGHSLNSELVKPVGWDGAEQSEAIRLMTESIQTSPQALETFCDGLCLSRHCPTLPYISPGREVRPVRLSLRLPRSHRWLRSAS